MPDSAFVPDTLDATDFAQIEPLLTALLQREITSSADLEQWLVDRSDLESAISEAQANLYITMTRHTDDEDAQRAYLSYIEHVAPRLKPLSFELDKRLVALSERYPLDPQRYEVILRDTRAGVDLFREENIPIQTELSRLEQRFEQIAGAQTVRFEGRERTLPEMATYQERPDRSLRERAWRAVAERRLEDGEALDALYDEMVRLRDEMARNADCPSFIEYAFKGKLRFDYTPADCVRFHASIERVVVPFNDRLARRRQEQLGVDRLRPWDLSVDPLGRGPLRPFEGGRELYERTLGMFRDLDPRLGDLFGTLGEGLDDNGTAVGTCLDLDTRPGKAPGGYQYMRDRSRRPFIFMNAAGLHADVETMIHEGGHAFHSLRCADEPLLHYRHAPIEFCEVASMAMELLSMSHWDAFYAHEGDLARAKRKQIEGAVSILPWIATIDAFQHWVYANPSHTREQRARAWLDLEERFGYAGRARVDFDGIDPRIRETAWHKQGHIFGVPFYYIEYAIAQLGALQLWALSLEKGLESAIDRYLSALSLGGSRPLPELFEAAGIRFDFSEDLLASLVDRAEHELAKLPE